MKKTLLQVRYGYPGLMITCNEYLETFPADEYRKIVVFLCGADSHAVRSQISADAIIFLNLAKKQLRGLSLSAVRKILSICRDEKVDLVLAHRYKSLKILTMVDLFYNPGMMVGAVHRFGQFETLPRRLVGRWFIRRGYKFIGVSEALRQDILAAKIGACAEDVLALVNCVDVDAMNEGLLPSESARRFLGLTREQFVVGTIARLSEAKDYPTLIESFGLIKKRIPESTLVIVGEGHLKGRIEQLVREVGLADSVLFTGRIDNAWRIVSAFDVFVLTSRSEPFGRVLLEAMIARVPIVASNTGGICEAVGNDFPLEPPGSSHQFAEAVIRVQNMDGREKERLTEKMYLRVQDKFSRQAFTRKLQDFIQAIT